MLVASASVCTLPEVLQLVLLVPLLALLAGQLALPPALLSSPALPLTAAPLPSVSAPLLSFLRLPPSLLSSLVLLLSSGAKAYFGLPGLADYLDPPLQLVLLELGLLEDVLCLDQVVEALASSCQYEVCCCEAPLVLLVAEQQQAERS